MDDEQQLLNIQRVQSLAENAAQSVMGLYEKSTSEKGVSNYDIFLYMHSQIQTLTAIYEAAEQVAQENFPYRDTVLLVRNGKAGVDELVEVLESSDDSRAQRNITWINQDYRLTTRSGSHILKDKLDSDNQDGSE